MITAQQILDKKEKKNYSVDVNATVIDALKIMAEKNIGALLVTDNEEFKGIFTERDYSRKIALEGRSSSDTKVAEVLSVHHPKINPKTIMEECMMLMSENNVRYLPVFDNGKLAGVVSISDVVNTIMDYQKETISHLKSYMGL